MIWRQPPTGGFATDLPVSRPQYRHLLSQTTPLLQTTTLCKTFTSTPPLAAADVHPQMESALRVRMTQLGCKEAPRPRRNSAGLSSAHGHSPTDARSVLEPVKGISLA